MNVDFSAVIVDIDGEPVPIPKKTAAIGANGAALNPADTEPLTLARTAVLALMEPDAERTSPEAKLDEYALAMKIRNGGKIDISAEDARLLTTRIAKRFPSFIVSGQAAHLLKG